MELSDFVRPFVSVVIPVYRVENYIEKCLHSLFGQSLENIEYIFIDDCSPDSSSEIISKTLDSYPERKHQVRHIRNRKNMGVAHARQMGISIAKGEYVIHCDPDDWIEADMYKEMYQKAKTDNADIVFCDFYEVTKDSEIFTKGIGSTDIQEIICEVLTGKYNGALWNKMIRRSLIEKHSLRIPDNISMWEDMCFSISAVYYSSIISHVPHPFYHYINRDGSIVRTINNKQLYSQLNAAKWIEAFLQHTTYNTYYKQLVDLKLRAKAILIESDSFYDPVKWNQIFPEIRNRIFINSGNYIHKLYYWLIAHDLYFASNIWFFLKKVKNNTLLRK